MFVWSHSCVTCYRAACDISLPFLGRVLCSFLCILLFKNHSCSLSLLLHWWCQESPRTKTTPSPTTTMYTTTTATLPAVVASATSPSFTWGTSPGMTPTSMSINNNNHSNAENNNSRIALYTGYYHQYQQHVTEWRRRMGQEPQNTTLCDLAQKHIDWAQYQAEECSRTAHYFHENPTAGTTPFPLPPPPTPIPAAGHSSRNALEMNPVVVSDSRVSCCTIYRFSVGDHVGEPTC